MSARDVQQLIWQSQRLPYGAERVAIVEEAVRLADSLGDEDLAYEARMEVVDAANWADMHDRALVAFSWCLARHDREPDEHDEYDLYWKFKWILQNITGFSNVSKKQITDMEDDFARRLSMDGFSPRPVEYIRCTNRAAMGDTDAARAHYDRWQNAPRDVLADCPACEADNEVDYFLCIGDDESALRIGRSLTSGDGPRCQEVPHRTHGSLVRPLLRMQLLDEAEANYKVGRRRLAGNVKLLCVYADLLLYLACTKKLPQALKLVERFLPDALTTTEEVTRMNFYAATYLTMKAAAERGKPFKLKLPDDHPLRRDDHQYKPEALSDWHRAEAVKLAQAFDRRNGNDAHVKGLSESEGLAGF